MMTRIEAIFGGILLIAVIFAVSFTALEKGLPNLFGSKPTTTVIDNTNRGIVRVGNGTSESAMSGQSEADLCACYERSFAYANAGYSLESVEYQSGYSACRSGLGAEGGNAWTYGWSKGEEGKLAQRSCKFYLNALKVRSR